MSKTRFGKRRDGYFALTRKLIIFLYQHTIMHGKTMWKCRGIAFSNLSNLWQKTMLNKEVCRQCITLRYKNIDNGWDEDDEKSWQKGLVYCRHTATLISIKKVVPCDYYLEHLMSEQKC
jgi:sulfur relay (sulfurtransferase) complex TusBCD TusD component (DsrE family)